MRERLSLLEVIDLHSYKCKISGLLNLDDTVLIKVLTI